MLNQTEIWKEIPGWGPIYTASNQGRIRSLDRFLVGTPNGRGYLAVSLCADGRLLKGARVHQLVARTFLGPRPKGLVVCHNNDNRTDNRLVNLRYDTQGGNLGDRPHPRLRMDIDEAEVLRLRAAGWTYQKIADQFSTSAVTVGRILSGKRFKA